MLRRLITVLTVSYSVGGKMTILDPMDTGEYSSLTSDIAEQRYLQFSLNGFSVLPNHLPELLTGDVRKSIYSDLSAMKFNHILDLHDTLVSDFNLNCSEVLFLSCKPWNISRAILKAQLQTLSEFDVNKLYEYSVEALGCCIDETNRMLLSIDVAPVNAILPPKTFHNIHMVNKEIMTLALLPKMGEVAGYFLKEHSIRLYYTALETSFLTKNSKLRDWTQDLRHVPVDSKAGGSVTFWCPLKFTESSLIFAKRSHVDISANNWFEDLPSLSGHSVHTSWNDIITNRYDTSMYSTLSIGDCTIHHGWTFHKLPSNNHDNGISAITFCYIYGNSTMLSMSTSADSTVYNVEKSENDVKRRNVHSDSNDVYGEWMKDLKSGDVIDHPLLPLVRDKKPHEVKNKSIFAVG